MCILYCTFRAFPLQYIGFNLISGPFPGLSGQSAATTIRQESAFIKLNYSSRKFKNKSYGKMSYFIDTFCAYIFILMINIVINNVFVHNKI